MSLARRRYEPDTIKFFPCTSSDVEGPRVIVMELAIRTSKAKEHCVLTHDRVVERGTYMKILSLYVTQTCPVRARGAVDGSASRYSSHTGAAIFTTYVRSDQGSQLVTQAPTRIQIKCPEIIEKPSLYLTSKDKELGADHCNCMSISTNRHIAAGRDLGPLARRYKAGSVRKKSGNIEKRTDIEEVKGVVLFFVWMCRAVLLRVTSPDHKNGADKCTSMSYSGGR